MSSFVNAQDKQSHIRNFCVIAHIDHGKSTLCDRLLEATGTVAGRDMRSQILDSNPIERERGITIKLAPVRMMYNPQSTMTNDQQGMKSYKNQFSALDIGNWSLNIANSAYTLNLIDTPGHVDFSYEVSRSLAACEGAILVVDATQGVQAQTIANLTHARKHGLTVIPVINKIDLTGARIEETAHELIALGFSPLLSSPNLSYLSPTISHTSADLLDSSPKRSYHSPNRSYPSGASESPLLISAKTGEGVGELLDAIITHVPPPKGVPSGTPRALVFSSQYDTHKGVVVFVRVVDGDLSFARPPLAKLRFLSSGAQFTPLEVGYFSPKMIPSDSLRCGEVGYIATGLKDIRLAKVGDTITIVRVTEGWGMRDGANKKPIHPFTDSPIIPLPGYQEPKPMVFLGLFPIDASLYQEARDAMEKLRLSDAAFTFRPMSSAALGQGFHCGFLGLLHSEIVQERLSREFGIAMLATSPSVEYRITSRGSETSIQSASEYPDPSLIEHVREPIMRVTIYTPQTFVGAVMGLSQEKRGAFIDMKYLHGATAIEQYGNTHHAMVEMTYLIPLSEMIVDFFDRLKAATEGYASMDYELYDYQQVDVVKVDILINHEPVDALSFLVVADQAQKRGRQIVERLSEVIPRQQFMIPIQAAIGGSSHSLAAGHIIARADVKAFRKDVTGKLYGGDRTRKDKLLDKQKRGKAKMKKVGNVEIPQSAFFAVFKR